MLRTARLKMAKIEHFGICTPYLLYENGVLVFDHPNDMQTKHKDVRSPLHPLPGGQSSFSGALLPFSTEYQGGPNVLNFGPLSVLWSILLVPVGFQRGVPINPHGGAERKAPAMPTDRK